MKGPPPQTDGEGRGVLLCPACGGTCAHHWRVTAHVRPAEDDPVHQVVTVFPDALFLLRDRRGNDLPPLPECPSARRSAVSIDLCCEFCGELSVVHFAQHKGETLTGTEVTQEGPATASGS